MRTTLRIEDDILSRLKSLARSQGVSLTVAANRVLRLGLQATANVADVPRYREATFAMGEPNSNLDKANALAAAMEDEELIAKLLMRK